MRTAKEIADELASVRQAIHFHSHTNVAGATVDFLSEVEQTGMKLNRKLNQLLAEKEAFEKS
jgi:hypothetical protein